MDWEKLTISLTSFIFKIMSYFKQISGCSAIEKTSPHHNRNVETQVTTFSTSAELNKLIYSGPLTSVVKGVKFFSLSTTIMSAALVPLLLTYGDSGIMTTIGLSFATMMIATPIILHWFSRSYVTKMYFDKEEDVYMAKTVTFILREATHKFKSADVAVPPVRNVFTTFVANGRPFLVDPRGFFNPNHFSQLMGQDQIGQEELEKMIKSMKDDEDWNIGKICGSWEKVSFVTISLHCCVTEISFWITVSFRGALISSVCQETWYMKLSSTPWMWTFWNYHRLTEAKGRYVMNIYEQYFADQNEFDNLQILYHVPDEMKSFPLVFGLVPFYFILFFYSNELVWIWYVQ